MTETGLSLGTPHYMSPEQATAEKDLTNRSDIYSLGAVLYEMLTGDPPHTGSSAQQIIMKIVTEEAQLVTDLRKSVPPHVAAATAQSLEKLPADRFTTAARFAEALGDVGFTTTRSSAPVGRADSREEAGARRRVGWTVVFAAVVVAFAAGWFLKPGATGAPMPVARFAIPVVTGHEMGDFAPNLAVSPDGQVLVYSTDDALYKWPIGRGASERFEGTEGACCPFFSPDGQWIMFWAGGRARRIPVDGGPVTDAPHIPAPFADWSLDDAIVYSEFFEGVFRVPAFGGTPEQLTAIDSLTEGDHMWPQLFPGGDLLLYTSLGPGMLWNAARIVVEDLATGAQTTVAERATFGRYVPTGHILYARADGTLEATPFDVERPTVTGPPFAVASGVRTAYWGGAASFAVSQGGTLAFVQGSSWENHRLTWIDRSGNVLSQFGRPVTVERLDLSPGDRYVVTYVASANADIYRFGTATGEERRLTFSETTEDGPVWSPDGQRVVYRAIESSIRHHLFAKAIDGPADSVSLYSSDHDLRPTSWSPDGTWLAFVDGYRGATRVVNLEDGSVLTVSAHAVEAQFSPDGRWLAYESRAMTQPEVYVVSFPELTDIRQVSLNGGVAPRWSDSSGELFFWDPDSETLMVSRVSTSGSFSNTVPRPLFKWGDYDALGYDVADDGRRFLVAAQNPEAPAREIQVVLNFFEELKAKVGN